MSRDKVKDGPGASPSGPKLSDLQLAACVRAAIEDMRAKGRSYEDVADAPVVRLALTNPRVARRLQSIARHDGELDTALQVAERHMAADEAWDAIPGETWDAVLAAPTQPTRKGRAPEARNKTVKRREDALRERMRALPPDELRGMILDGAPGRLLGADATDSTAHRDFWNVAREEIAANRIDVLTPWAQAVSSGDETQVARERHRLKRLSKRL